MAPRPSRAIAAAAIAGVLGTCLAGLTAQDPAVSAPAGSLASSATSSRAAPVAFTAPDGSRFLLVPDASVPHVHWAVATFVDATDEPPGLEGLAYTVARASSGGTWHTGSVDALRERQALADLDLALQEALQKPGDAAAKALVVKCTEAATALGDTTAFPRVLAALPVHRPEVVERQPVCIFLLTTLPTTIGDVGRLLVERREDQALRELPQMWIKDLDRRSSDHASNPAAAVRAEVLALAMPSHPAGRYLERPLLTAARRDRAMAVWESTQRPERTVHVLFGGFDAAAATATLGAVFTSTRLGKYTAATNPGPRPFQALRRSVVPGALVPMVALAWVLPPIADRFVLEAAVHWLGGGLDSRIGQDLQRAGRSQARVQCLAPWPSTIDGQSLLLLEVTDPQGTDTLSDFVVQACRTAAQQAPAPASLEPVLAAMLRRWSDLTDDPRQLTVELAAAAVLWPRQTQLTRMPERIDARAMQTLLAQTFANQPVVVEGRR